MRAGPLRHNITIQSIASFAVDAVGGRTPTWSDFATVHADVMPVSGKEADFARTFAATVSHKITIRYLASVTPEMRVTWGSRVFEINAALNTDERNRESCLYCTEILNPLPAVTDNGGGSASYDTLSEDDFDGLGE